MFILMDTESAAVKAELRLNFTSEITTVSRFLIYKRAAELLNEEDLLTLASKPIENQAGMKSKAELEKEMLRKSEATQCLIRKYKSGFIYLEIFYYDTCFYSFVLF